MRTSPTSARAGTTGSPRCGANASSSPNSNGYPARRFCSRRPPPDQPRTSIRLRCAPPDAAARPAKPLFSIQQATWDLRVCARIRVEHLRPPTATARLAPLRGRPPAPPYYGPPGPNGQARVRNCPAPGGASVARAGWSGERCGPLNTATGRPRPPDDLPRPGDTWSSGRPGSVQTGGPWASAHVSVNAALTGCRGGQMGPRSEGA